jgi:zinc protease
MKPNYIVAIVASAILILASGEALSEIKNATTETYKLDNGMTVILKENHSSPMITSVVFVNAGARYETDYNNGVTHFLEHLLFDGTKTRNRAELNETVEMYGGYINAFTRKDLTAYLILMPKEYIEIGLDIQSDQLLNSIIPEEELPKERKIVIEEMKQTLDDPDNAADDFFTQAVYRGTPYARPVLGYENIIATIPRDRILEYYTTYYMPNNMTALVIGDFDSNEMLALFEKYFGSRPAQPLPEFGKVHLTVPSGRSIERAEMGVENTHVGAASNAPHFSDHDYFAFYLISEFLSSDDISPLSRALTQGSEPIAQSVSASLETQRDFSLLEIRATCSSAPQGDSAIAVIERTLANTDNLVPSEDQLRGLIVSLKTNDIYLREKLHYYGIMIAPMMVSTGYEFLENLIPNLEKVTRGDISRVAKKYFSQPAYIATIVTPQAAVDTVAEVKSATEFLKEVLPNGLTVVVKCNPDSRVFAANVLGKNRSAMEPAGKDGITDFVNQLLTEGTSSRSKEQLSAELTSIGANVTVADNPYIPYDDFYTTHQFSFIKFETIDEYAEKGLTLLSDMIANAVFNDNDVERVRKQKLGLIGRSSGSTRDQCRSVFYRLLFDGGSYSKPIPGTMQSISSITRDDLIAHYRSFYSPGNLILTVCTNEPAADAMENVKRHFGGLIPASISAPEISQPISPTGAVSMNAPMDKEQVYIYIGGPLPGIDSEDAPALDVAASILSDRMGQELREKQGLAYSVGASANLDREFGWYVAAIGTGRENFQVARDGIVGEIRKLQNEAVSPDEIKKAVNSSWGSSLTRNLSRVNQAYYMGVNEFLGVGYDFGSKWIEKLRAVTPDAVQRVAKQYFSTENYFLATAGLKE